MRKFVYTAMGAAALATASIANAAVTVNPGSVIHLNDPNPSATSPSSIVTSGNITTINFGLNPITVGDNNVFHSSFVIDDTMAGLYAVVVGTSSSGVTFTSGSLQALVGGVLSGSAMPFNVTDGGLGLRLGPPGVTLGAGDYQLTVDGTAANAGSFTGNVTIMAAAVPEAATWAMMLMGFAGMGLVIRRRRQPVLAQLA